MITAIKLISVYRSGSVPCGSPAVRSNLALRVTSMTNVNVITSIYNPEAGLSFEKSFGQYLTT